MLRTEARSGFLNFDWGFQSIAQSKFQRTASFLGERFPRRHFRSSSSTLFRNFFENLFWKEQPTSRFLALASLVLASDASRREGGTCKASFLNQALLKQKILSCRKCLNKNMMPSSKVIHNANPRAISRQHNIC